jgi:predicted lysophospholipase L1 biosynthesis ABC-type transport system permease subunit
MEVLYQLSYPGGWPHCSGAIRLVAMASEPDPQAQSIPQQRAAISLLRVVLPAGSLIFLLIGIGLYIAVDELIGAIFIGAAVVELLTMPLVFRSLSRGLSSRERSAIEAGEEEELGGAPEPAAEPDPSYNPYARED